MRIWFKLSGSSDNAERREADIQQAPFADTPVTQLHNLAAPQFR
jgi:hypothetical protein